MDNPFSWSYITSMPGPNDVFDVFGIVFLAFFSVGFLASIFFYNDGARLITRHTVKRRTMRRGSGIAMAVFAIGLFFFGIRILQINPLSFGLSLWLWLSLLAALAMLAYFAYYLRTVYKEELHEYDQRKHHERNLAAAAASIGGRKGGTVRLEPRRPV